MRLVSDRFRAALAGSHKPVFRATVVDAAPQFTEAPTGTVVPILGGDVRLASTAQIRSTATVEIPGRYWDLVQPLGAELYLERGIEFAPGDAEYVGLGYHRVQQVEQLDAPNGSLRLICMDRTAQLLQNQVEAPLVIDAGTTHTAAFSLLVNGDAGGGQSTSGYGAYLYTPIPIIFDAYPGGTVIFGDQVVEDDSYKLLATLAGERKAALVFNARGELTIVSTLAGGPPVATIAAGPGGSQLRAGRVASRDGVHNIVTAYGSDPTAVTDYVVSRNVDPNSPLAFNKRTHPAFGPAPRFYASPLLQDDELVANAADVLLGQYTGLPTVYDLTVKTDPSLEPLDVVAVRLKGQTVATNLVIDTMTIPLTAAPAGRVATRTLNDPERISP